MEISNEFEVITKEVQDKMFAYREIILSKGFFEPTQFDPSEENWRFYKPFTDLTALVLNLNYKDEQIEVYYGCASTAFTLMKGCENVLIEDGVSNESINLRKKTVLPIEFDNVVIDIILKDLYEEYSYIDKDNLLNLVKEKRKTFINKFTSKLKPMGFKKKANSWKYDLQNDYYLLFEVQKSRFSDEYYFNVYIAKENSKVCCDCFYRRIAPDNMFPMDWQTISDELFEKFLNEDLEKLLKHIISTPLNELGKEDLIIQNCNCDRKQCDFCWVNETKVR